ncbi:uncharacterized protein SPSK_05115 [Sporothrix schenckii 1099-18]|uniref:Uncharacterized protein n=1 Tax=Sporothrix schenckii 1099-18 TaxID=1397361 RepID=A0A0F2LVD7_SPOSC|nr:uncharacterized protein SPSK_05115 [Sporothrix schenckii 1099-18]KJR80435.1 hypothetical protein SPSK_05115 [Sporothrix schenckii 1099-18]
MSSDKPSDLPLGNIPAERPPDPFMPFDPPDAAYSDSEDSNIFSGVSSPGQKARRDMRVFPPVHTWSGASPAFSSGPIADSDPAAFLPVVGYRYDDDHIYAHPQMSDGELKGTNIAFSQKANTIPAISNLWADLFNQRQGVRRYHKRMSELRSQIQSLRSEKTKADNALHRLALSHSLSGQALPPVRSALLIEKVRSLHDTYASVEAQYEKLETELNLRQMKLEFSESRFFQSIPSVADASGQEMSILANIPFRPASNHTLFQNSSGRESDPRVQTAPVSRSVYSMVPADERLLGISGERPGDVHPLYTHLLRTISALKTSREKYEDLVSERDDILESVGNQLLLDRSRRNQDTDLNNLELNLRAAVKSDLFQDRFAGYLDDSDREFLKRFGEQEKIRRGAIIFLEQQVASIRETCVRKAILPVDLPPKSLPVDSDDGYEYDGDDDMAISFATRDLHPNVKPVTTSFPVLVTDPLLAIKQYPLAPKDAIRKVIALPEDDPKRRLLLDDYVKEYGILSSLSRFESGNKADFVNRWLLQSLRMSPMAAVLLYTEFSGILRVINIGQWQNDVVHFWAHDGTNVPEPYFGGPVTEALSSCSSTTSSSFIVENHGESGSGGAKMHV